MTPPKTRLIGATAIAALALAGALVAWQASSDSPADLAQLSDADKLEILNSGDADAISELLEAEEAAAQAHFARERLERQKREAEIDVERAEAAVLEEARADAPLVPFGDIEDDAEFWAAMATYEELRAYFLACGKRLARRQLGRRGKIRLAQLLLADLTDEDRQTVVATPRTGDAGRQVIQPELRQAEGPRR